MIKTTIFLSHLFGKFIMEFPSESKHFWGRAKRWFQCASGVLSRLAPKSLTEGITCPLSLRRKKAWMCLLVCFLLFACCICLFGGNLNLIRNYSLLEPLTSHLFPPVNQFCLEVSSLLHAVWQIAFIWMISSF